MLIPQYSPILGYRSAPALSRLLFAADSIMSDAWAVIHPSLTETPSEIVFALLGGVVTLCALMIPYVYSES